MLGKLVASDAIRFGWVKFAQSRQTRQQSSVQLYELACSHGDAQDLLHDVVWSEANDNGNVLA